MRPLLPLLALSLALAAPSPARADTNSEAKAHFKKASEAHKQARYQDAITEFQAAYKVKPAAVLHYNLAQCYEKLGDIPSALREYHDYLREDPQATDRATVETAIANLERRLQEKGVQQLLVYSEPPEADVKLDGKTAGLTPLAVVLPPGKHSVALSKDGYVGVTRQVVTTPDKSVELNFSLQKGSGPPIVLAPEGTPDIPPAEKPLAKPEEKAAPALTATAPPEPAPSKPRLWTWVAAGAAGAALVGGTLVGLSARSNETKLKDGTFRPGSDNQKLASSAQNQAVAANVLFGVAGVAAATSVALFFVEGSF